MKSLLSTSFIRLDPVYFLQNPQIPMKILAYSSRECFKLSLVRCIQFSPLGKDFEGWTVKKRWKYFQSWNGNFVAFQRAKGKVCIRTAHSIFLRKVDLGICSRIYCSMLVVAALFLHTFLLQDQSTNRMSGKMLSFSYTETRYHRSFLFCFLFPFIHQVIKKQKQLYLWHFFSICYTKICFFHMYYYSTINHLWF